MMKRLTTFLSLSLIFTEILGVSANAYAAAEKRARPTKANARSSAKSKPARGNSSAASVAAELERSSSSGNSGIHLGMHGGMSVSNASTTSRQGTSDLSSRASFATGIGAEIDFSSYFAFRPEMNYVRRGAVLESKAANTASTVGSGTNNPTVSSTTVALNYLEFPLLMKAGYPLANGIRPFVLAGPALAFRVSATRTADKRNGSRIVSATSQSNSSSEDVSKAYQTVDFLGHFGGGVDIPIARNWSVLVDGRYIQGFTNAVASEISKNDPKSSIRNHAVQFITGLQYEL